MYINANTRLTIFLFFIAAVVTTGIVAYAAGASNERASQPPYTVTVEEDGSGTQTIGDRVVKTFDEDTFVWDCHVMGNTICG